MYYEQMLQKYGLDVKIFSLTGGTGQPGQDEPAADTPGATEEVTEYNFPPPQHIQSDNDHKEPVKCSKCRHVQLIVKNGIFWQCNLKNIDIDDGNVPIECSKYVDKDSRGGDDDHLEDEGNFLL